MQDDISSPRFLFGQAAALAVEQEFSLDRDFLRKEFSIDLRTPDFRQIDYGFWISESEFADINQAISCLGPEGTAVCEGLRAFVRSPDLR
jgi:hypothetical protein